MSVEMSCQDGGWLYAMLVILQSMIEEHKSCLMQHST